MSVGTTPQARASAGRRFLSATVWSLLAAAGALGLGPLWAQQPLLALANWVVCATFAAAAVLLAEEPGQESHALLFLGATVCWIAGYTGGALEVGIFPLIQWLIGPLVFPLLALILLRYPERHLRHRADRAYVCVLFAWLTIARISTALVSEPEWYKFGSDVVWPTLAPNAGLNSTIDACFEFGIIALAIAFVVLMIRRFRSTSGLDRQVLAPVIVAAAASGVVVCAEVATLLMSREARPRVFIYAIEAVALIAIPGSFLVAAIRSRMARVSVADLVLQLSRSGTKTDLRDGLRRALRDPGLDIYCWAPGSRTFVDTEDMTIDPSTITHRTFVINSLGEDDMPLAIVATDSPLERHREVLDATLAAARFALENTQLNASMLDQLAEIRAARARVVQAGAQERRRMERDLHDGAQQRLLALSLRVAASRVDGVGSADSTILELVRSELHETMQELRAFAHGVHPVVLTQAGLGPALAGVAERLPVPVVVDVPDQRWDTAVESTAYFLACEALANTVRHASASAALVRVQTAGEWLSIEIVDDGVGGADLSRGTGLSGVRDRVLAMGGDIQVFSAANAGTRIIARVPCG